MDDELKIMTAEISRKLPDSKISVDRPDVPSGPTFVDVGHAETAVVVVWTKSEFTVCSEDPEIVPDTVLKDPIDVANEVVNRLTKEKETG